MNMSDIDRLQGLHGELRHGEPMSRHVSWRAGGPADRFYVPADIEDLAAFLPQLPREEPLLFKPGQFYALIAIGACIAYLVLSRSHQVTDDQAGMITVVGTFVLRMLAIRFNWRTTALYRERPPPVA